jgi:hypothetical protein
VPSQSFEVYEQIFRMYLALLIVEYIASGNITNAIHDVAKVPRENS